MKKSALVVGLLAMLFATATAFAQHPTMLQAKIPFEFVAGGKTFPAGEYDFKVIDGFVQMSNRATQQTYRFQFLTRIAADSTAKASPRVTFDVKDGKRFVEAIWPSAGDGYLLHTVKGEHTHDTVGE